jgi:galactosyl transferase GMA12/MNN10 family
MFTIVSYYTPDYYPLVEKTWFDNKVIYCNIHKYSHELLRFRWNGMHDAQVIKMRFLKDLCSRVPEDSWIWWTGSDLMITNFKITLDSRVDNKYHWIIASDFNGINADSIFIKNSQLGREYLNLIDDIVKTTDHWEGEQHAIKITHKEYPNIVKVVPQREINAYQYDLYKNRHEYAGSNWLDDLGTDGNWQKGDFAIQWPACSLSDRLNLYEKYNEMRIL